MNFGIRPGARKASERLTRRVEQSQGPDSHTRACSVARPAARIPPSACNSPQRALQPCRMFPSAKSSTPLNWPFSTRVHTFREKDTVYSAADRYQQRCVPHSPDAALSIMRRALRSIILAGVPHGMQQQLMRGSVGQQGFSLRCKPCRCSPLIQEWHGSSKCSCSI